MPPAPPPPVPPPPMPAPKPKVHPLLVVCGIILIVAAVVLTGVSLLYVGSRPSVARNGSRPSIISQEESAALAAIDKKLLSESHEAYLKTLQQPVQASQPERSARSAYDRHIAIRAIGGTAVVTMFVPCGSSQAVLDQLVILLARKDIREMVTTTLITGSMNLREGTHVKVLDEDYWGSKAKIRVIAVDNILDIDKSRELIGRECWAPAVGLRMDR
jgi:hypothetical protein